MPTDRQYTSQISEPQLGIYFYNARFYDSTLGRFISPDTYVQESQGVLAWDRYIYCKNNPLRYTDSTGHFIDPFSLLVGAMIVGAVVSGVVDAYQQYQSTGTIDAGQVAYSALGGAVLAGGVVIAGVAAVTVAGGVAAAVTGGGAVATAACADGDCTNEANAGAKAAVEVADDIGQLADDYLYRFSSGSNGEFYEGLREGESAMSMAYANQFSSPAEAFQSVIGRAPGPMDMYRVTTVGTLQANHYLAVYDGGTNGLSSGHVSVYAAEVTKYAQYGVMWGKQALSKLWIVNDTPLLTK